MPGGSPSSQGISTKSRWVVSPWLGTQRLLHDILQRPQGRQSLNFSKVHPSTRLGLFPMNIQYLGFAQDLKCRRYSFRVIETLKPDREFQLSVENQAVAACKFKFQDIPDL